MYSASENFSCSTANGTTAQTMSIDCGNGTPVTTQNNVASMQTTCNYTTTTLPTLPQKATCYVNNTTNSNCTQGIILDRGTFGQCGDGIRQGREKCDLGADNQKIYDYLDNNVTNRSYAGIYANAGYSCVGCSIQKNNVSAENVACFNVGNTNLSVQADEILPFWRTIDTENSPLISHNDCTTNNPSSQGKVDRDSLMCEFSVYNGTHLQANGYPLATFTQNCATNTRLSPQGNVREIFNYILDQGKDRRSLQHAFGKYNMIMS